MGSAAIAAAGAVALGSAAAGAKVASAATAAQLETLSAQAQGLKDEIGALEMRNAILESRLQEAQSQVAVSRAQLDMELEARRRLEAAVQDTTLAASTAVSSAERGSNTVDATGQEQESSTPKPNLLEANSAFVHISAAASNGTAVPGSAAAQAPSVVAAQGEAVLELQQQLACMQKEHKQEVEALQKRQALEQGRLQEQVSQLQARVAELEAVAAAERGTLEEKALKDAEEVGAEKQLKKPMTWQAKDG
jgi:hypothetical protein